MGKSVILVCKGVEKSQQAHFMDVKGCEAQLSIFMEIALYVSIIIIIAIIIIIIISIIIVIIIIIIIIIIIKKGDGLGLGVESPCIKLCWVPPTTARSKTHE